MKKMSKKISIAVASFLVTLMIISLFAFPTIDAHDPPWELPTYTYVGVQNNPVGVGQEVLIVFWLNELPRTAVGAYGDRFRFYIDITTPSGENETLGGSTGFVSDPVGAGFATYTPTETGTYKIAAKFPGHTYTGEPAPPPGSGITARSTQYIGDILEPSESNPIYLVVQEEAVQPWSEAPLPTEYWNRPINSMSRSWGQLASNWLGSSSFQRNGSTTNFAWGQGPESAHVMWTRPMWAGGIMDARFDDLGYDTVHYEGLSFTPPIILDGVLYYNVRSHPRMGWYAVDLYTGETNYFHNTTGSYVGAGGGFDAHGAITGESLAYGQLLYIDYPNQHGGFPYLWSTTVPDKSNTWRMFDAFTGNYMVDIANVSSGTLFMDNIGSICAARIQNLGNSSNPKPYLQIWNTTHAIWYEDTWRSNEYWMWRPNPNMTFNGNNGFSLNVSVPASITGSIMEIRPDQYIIGGTSGSNDVNGVEKGHLWCLSLEQGSEGSLLWDTDFTPPKSSAPDPSLIYRGGISGPDVYPEYDVFCFYERVTMQRWGYDLKSGQQIWGPTSPEVDFSYYGTGTNVYNGLLLTSGYGGQVRAYDIKTGETVWTYNATNIGYESAYGGNYPTGVGVICDGKLYLVIGEHSFTQPLMRGPNLRCLNATTGEEIWKVKHWGGGMSPTTNYMVIADGYLVGPNFYDNQIYCYGKGPSATSVTAGPKSIVQGNSVVIEGMVTDLSPGTSTLELAARFPNGVPAISDADQSAWMEYLYMDQEKPVTASGVEIKFATLDPNGNYYEIGNATSDSSGVYSLAFTPEVPGLYKIYATFEGTNSYYASTAETAVNVEEPSQATPEQPETQQQSMTDSYFLPAVIAIILAIAIGFAVTILLLRKRP
jgi:hypothetical protein